MNKLNSKTIICICSLLLLKHIEVMSQSIRSENSRREIPQMQAGQKSRNPMRGMMPGVGMNHVGVDIHQFGVNFSPDIPKENDVLVKDDKDSMYVYFVENIAFSKTIKIHFESFGAQISALPDGVQVVSDGAYLTVTSTLTEPLSFEISGKTEDGALICNVQGPSKLLFNNVTLKSQRGDAILVKGKEPVYAVLGKGTVNILSDCRNPELPPMMDFPDMFMNRAGGNSPLEGRNDISAKQHRELGLHFKQSAEEGNPEDYHVLYGIRMKKPKKKEKLKIDGTFVCDGSLTFSGEGELIVQSNNKVGIKSKSSLMFRPGNKVSVTALSGKGVNAKNELYIYGGMLNVDCSISADKAVTSGRNMYIKGGHVVVKAAGGESSEGIQSKFLLQIDGGKVEVVAQDDAINSQGDLVVNGGTVRAFSVVNDAIDANCNMIINGGDVFASGNGMPEGGLDCNEEDGYRLFINGGTVVAVGGRHSYPENQSRQPSVVWRLDSLSANQTYSIDSECSYFSSRDYQIGGATLLMSSPKLKQGAACSLRINGEEVESLDSVSLPFSLVGNQRRW